MSATITTVMIQGNVTWKIGRDPETGRYLGVCPALNLNAMGDTWGEVIEGASQAVTLLMVDLFEDDELERFLRERGFSPLHAIPRGGPTPKFDVPFNFEDVPVGELVALQH